LRRSSHLISPKMSSSTTHCPLTPLPRNPNEYPHTVYLTFPETRIIVLYFAADIMSLFIQFCFCWVPYNDFFPQECVSAVKGHPLMTPIAYSTLIGPDPIGCRDQSEHSRNHSAVKLFSKNSNLCDQGTGIL